jgi:hypothetical protein
MIKPPVKVLIPSRIIHDCCESAQWPGPPLMARRRFERAVSSLFYADEESSKENIPNFFWILIYFANFLAVIC